MAQKMERMEDIVSLRYETRQVGIICAVYLVCLLFVGRFDTYNFLVNRIISPLFVIYVVYTYIRRPTQLPTEAFLFTLFIAWTTSGLAVAENMRVFWKYYKLTFQVGILFVAFSFLATRYNIISWIMLAFLVNGILYVGYSMMSGELVKSIASTEERYRLASLVANANGYSYALLLGAIGMFYFFGLTKNITTRALHILVLMLLLVGIVFSASRKTYITLVAFVIVYTILYLQAKGRSLVLTTIILSLTGLVVYYITSYILENSFLGIRFMQLRNIEDLTVENNRYWLYLDGIRMFWANPLFGVGLGQFKMFSSTSGYAHSDFMEVLATTGLIGFVFYTSIYVLLFKRLFAIKKLPGAQINNYQMNFIMTTMVCLIAMSLGRPNFLDIFTMPMFAVFIGQSFYIHNMRRNRVVEAIIGSNNNRYATDKPAGEDTGILPEGKKA